MRGSHGKAKSVKDSATDQSKGDPVVWRTGWCFMRQLWQGQASIQRRVDSCDQVGSLDLDEMDSGLPARFDSDGGGFDRGSQAAASRQSGAV